MVRAVSAEIGGSRVYFESVQVATCAAAHDRYGTADATLGMRDVRDAYTQLKSVIREISADLAGAVADRASGGPSSVQVTFGLAFSGEANAWVVRTSGDASLSATVTWTSPADPSGHRPADRLTAAGAEPGGRPGPAPAPVTETSLIEGGAVPLAATLPA
jgi:hypothetical protein